MEGLPKDKFLEYERLKVEQRAIDDRLKELLKEIMPHVNEDMDKLKGQFGTFSVKALPRYKYSEALEEKKKHLKEEEAEERATGEAEFIGNILSLVYTKDK